MSDARQRAEDTRQEAQWALDSFDAEKGRRDFHATELAHHLRALLAETAPAPPQAREVEEAAEEALVAWRTAWLAGCAETPAGIATAAIGLKTALESLLAETGATPDVAEEVSAVRHRIDNGRRCRDCGEALGITAYADDLLDKFAQAPAPPAVSDEEK